MGVQIRTPGWKLEWLYTTRLDDRTKRIREFRIAVMDEVSTVFEETPFIHGDIPSDLHHPGLIGMLCDPGDLNPTALELDKEQHVVSGQAAQCQHFHSEEVGSCENVHVSANKVFPRRPVHSLRHGRYIVATEDISHRLIRWSIAQIGQRAHDSIVSPSRYSLWRSERPVARVRTQCAVGQGTGAILNHRTCVRPASGTNP